MWASKAFISFQPFKYNICMFSWILFSLTNLTSCICTLIFYSASIYLIFINFNDRFRNALLFPCDMLHMKATKKFSCRAFLSFLCKLTKLAPIHNMYVYMLLLLMKPSKKLNYKKLKSLKLLNETTIRCLSLTNVFNA